jgi:hypothetical protein
VPILLGAYIVQDEVPGAHRLYEIIFVVVAFSVIVQGGTVPWLLRRLKIPLRTIEPEPWSLGVRFQHEPEGLHRFVVAPGAAAAATPVGDLPVTEDAWISLLIRDGRLVPVRSDTILRAGDEAVVLSADPDAAGADRAVRRARSGLNGTAGAGRPPVRGIRGGRPAHLPGWPGHVKMRRSGDRGGMDVGAPGKPGPAGSTVSSPALHRWHTAGGLAGLTSGPPLEGNPK